MTDLERAIRLYENAAECPCDTYAPIILEALREKMERSKGCAVCISKSSMCGEENWLDDNVFFINSGKLFYSAYVHDAGGSMQDQTKINYCPDCGRKLDGGNA